MFSGGRLLAEIMMKPLMSNMGLRIAGGLQEYAKFIFKIRICLR